MVALFTGLTLGLLQGVRHAFEPDHLAAVTTIVAERRARRQTQTMLLGAAWGLGHTITLVLVGGAMLLLRESIPPQIESAFELAVAFMLVFLGTRGILRAVRDGRAGPRTVHAHGAEKHEHSGPHDHLHVRGWTLARRPLLIGLVHGLAGSGALTALVLSRVTSTAAGIAFMVLFGLGSTLGMAVLTGVLGLPLAQLARHPRAMPIVMGVTSAISLVVGVAWAVRALV
jgi:ABC-type nickel/cobalt efflux system permease component RcnA